MSSQAVTARTEGPDRGEMSSQAVTRSSRARRHHQMSSQAVMARTEGPDRGEMSSQAVALDTRARPSPQMSRKPSRGWSGELGRPRATIAESAADPGPDRRLGP